MVDGKRLPSVTEICRFLAYDTAANAKPWLRDEAAERGSRIHAWCALYDYEDLNLDAVEQDARPYVRAYLSFCRDYHPVWDYIEHHMGSVSMGYAGTLDRYGTIDGQRVLLDIKTGYRLQKVPLSAQLAGYALLLQKEQLETQRFYGLHLDRYGCYDLAEITPDEALFCCCMTIHKKLERKKRA